MSFLQSQTWIVLWQEKMRRGGAIDPMLQPSGILALALVGHPFIAFIDFDQDPPALLPNPAQLPTVATWGGGIDWSPDGRFTAINEGTGTRVYDWASGAPVAVPNAVPANRVRQGLGWSTDGNYMGVTHHSGGAVTMLEHVGNGVFTLLPNLSPNPPGAGQQIDWSPDARHFVVASDTGAAHLYNFEGPTPVAVAMNLVPGTAGTAATWTNDSRYFVIADNWAPPFIHLFDITTGTPVRVPWNPPIGVLTTDVAFSPNNKYLAVARYANPGVHIYEWNPIAPVLKNFPIFNTLGQASGLGWSPNGRYLAVRHTPNANLAVFDWISGEPELVTNVPVVPGGRARWGIAWRPQKYKP